MKLEPVNKNEVIRYLRYGNHTPDEIIMNMIDECEQILLRKITPAFTYKIFDKAKFIYIENFTNLAKLDLKLIEK